MLALSGKHTLTRFGATPNCTFGVVDSTIEISISEISKNILNYLSKSLKENKMKKLIDNLIVHIVYKHPHLWLEINEAIFDDIEDYKKKIHKKILQLIRKFK